MKALLSRSPGGPETLTFEDIATPEPLPHQLLIDVKAVAVNFPDVIIIRDRYQYRPDRPFSPGTEIAGVVRVAGPATSGFAVGDRVAAVCGWGGMAEQVAVDAGSCTRLPGDFPFDQAAALLFTYGTALYALETRGALRPGDTLLILGAAGGVGLAAVDLGRFLGARVIAGVSTDHKRELVLQRGAHDAVVYPAAALDVAAQKALADRFKAACGGGADVVLDNIGGDYAEPALRSTAWNGRYLIVGFAAGVARIPLNVPLLKGFAVVGVFWGEWLRREPERFRADAAKLVALAHAGKIRPHISRRLPLAEGARAIRELEERAALGKIVLLV